MASAPSTTLKSASSPAMCPSVRASPRFAAQRPLPSMTQATWTGIRPGPARAGPGRPHRRARRTPPHWSWSSSRPPRPVSLVGSLVETIPGPLLHAQAAPSREGDTVRWWRGSRSSRARRAAPGADADNPERAASVLARIVGEMAGGGEERPGQAEMAARVARAIRTGTHLVVQAGTGTGKSLAYLAPAAGSGAASSSRRPPRRSRTSSRRRTSRSSSAPWTGRSPGRC